MIQKLRWKFVFTIMTVVTILLLVMFGMLYRFTQIQLEQESIAMMRSVIVDQRPLGLPDELSGQVRLPYFALQLGMDRDVVDTLGGYYDLSDQAFLGELVGRVMQSKGNIGTLEDLNLRYFRSDLPAKQWIVFTDMSNEQVTLENLTQTCVVVGILSFGVFFVLSLFLSSWAVNPVEKAWNQQRQFVADASHELKTPLTILNTNAQLLQEDGWDNAHRKQFTQHIQEMAQHMNRLVEQMLELSRGDLVQDTGSFEQVGFSKLVSDGVLPHEGVLFEHGLTLDCSIAPSVHISGDAGALKQVLDILLDNAGKYAQTPGEVTVCLTRDMRQGCLLSVSNPGVPIPPEQLHLIFQRFYRADPAHSRDGSFGLGLAIAQNIVTRHRGKIWAESQQGINTFFVKLPTI